MESRIRKIIEGLNLREGTSADDLSNLMKSMNTNLPLQYIEFMRYSNGADGFIRDSYLLLWKVEEISSVNKESEVEIFAPGLLLFGSDGGGEGYAFDMRTEAKPIVNVPLIGMEIDAVVTVASTFNEFLEFYS